MVYGLDTSGDNSPISTSDPAYQAMLAGNLTSFSSSPFSLAGIDKPPISTLNTGSLSDQQHASLTQPSITDIINGLGNIVLGGIAVSRIPSQNIGATSTTMAGKTTGTTIVPAGAAVGSASLMPLLLIGLVIVGVVLLAKKL